MNYQSARREVIVKRVVGSIIALVCAAFVLIGLLLYVYDGIELAGSALTALTSTVRRLVYYLYRHTQFLRFVWDHAAVPDLKALASRDTLMFLGWYAGFFVGASLVGSGNRLARRLRRVDRQIEDEQMRDSARGARVRPRVEIEAQITVKKQSVWRQIHTLYVAPVVVGVILLILAKLAG